MPVVLYTSHGKESAGYTYDDRTGISYEYPSGRYEAWITSGEPFVYIEGGVGYTGTGIIGQIKPSTTAGRLVCTILDYQPFDHPVDRTDPDSGDYIESDKQYWQKDPYWGQGVRPLSVARLQRILELANLPLPASSGASAPKPKSPSQGYGSPENNVLVDAYAMKVALVETETRFKVKPEPMPHNNPGYDIRVGPLDNPIHHVEVKGTQSSEKAFFLSEGQRLFSAEHAAKYSLVVISGINLKKQTHEAVTWHDGEITKQSAGLVPDHWRGRLG